VFKRSAPPDAVYSLKHALVQEAAHGSPLRGSRQQLHAQIAEALEAHSPELMGQPTQLFAQHYAEGGSVEKSVASWGKAGRRSAAGSAMAEAAAQFQKALEQLALLPTTPERQRRVEPAAYQTTHRQTVTFAAEWAGPSSLPRRVPRGIRVIVRGMILFCPRLSRSVFAVYLPYSRQLRALGMHNTL
jgi:predicted ATPase